MKINLEQIFKELQAWREERKLQLRAKKRAF